MRRPVHPLMQVFRDEAGHKVRVEVAKPPDDAERLTMPRRIIAVNKPSLFSAGMVVSGMGRQFLLAEHSELEGMIQFQAFQVTDLMSWRRRTETIHPVALVKTQGGTPQELDAALPVTLEPRHTEEEQGFEKAFLRAWTAASVQVGDNLGPYTVRVADSLRGLRRLEVS